MKVKIWKRRRVIRRGSPLRTRRRKGRISLYITFGLNDRGQLEQAEFYVRHGIDKNENKTRQLNCTWLCLMRETMSEMQYAGVTVACHISLLLLSTFCFTCRFILIRMNLISTSTALYPSILTARLLTWGYKAHQPAAMAIIPRYSATEARHGRYNNITRVPREGWRLVFGDV